MKRVLSLRNFQLLFAGAFVSLLGDQFALIATPWLVLQLTGWVALHPSLKAVSESMNAAQAED